MKINIVLFCFLLYFTYFIQFLDIKLFLFFKYYYINNIVKAIWLENKNLASLSFLPHFSYFRIKILS